MIALNRAPGLMRTYDAEKWSWVGDVRWKAAREQAIAAVRTDLTLDMCGSDIDPACVVLAQENAKKAGVGHFIRFEQADAAKRIYPQSGVLFANPPYGERLMDRESAQAIYRAVGRAVGKSELRQYYLTSDPEFERFYGYQADKRRKLYNGMIKCDLYMYFRPQEARRPFGRRDSKVPNSGKRERR